VKPAFRLARTENRGDEALKSAMNVVAPAALEELSVYVFGCEW
jgi:hypothetical protein